MSGPFECGTCGLTHPRGCTAHKDRDRTVPCGNWPAKGSNVCRYHGAAAPQVAAAAEKRQVDAEAQAVIQKLWAGLDAAAPVKDPVASMERLAGALEQLVDESGRRVNELQHLAGGEHLTQLRAEVTLLERALGHLRGLLVDMARLGIAERHLQLEQERANVVVAAFLAALDVAGLAPGVRSLAVDRFLERLGDLVPAGTGAVVAGEIEA